MSASRLFLPLDAKRYRALDGLRGLAVLLIFNTHFLAQYADKAYFLPRGSVAFQIAATLHSGLVGVDVFFILSGMLTYLSINYKRPTAVNFVVGRYRRLLPVILAVNVPALCFGVTSVSSRQIFDNIFFLKLFPETTFITHVTWVLTYEIYFYLLCLVWFILLGRFRIFQGVRPFLVLCALFVCNVVFARRFGVYCDVRFLGFFYGVILGMLVSGDKIAKIAAYLPARLWPVFLALIFGCSFVWGYGPTQHVIFNNWYANFAFYCVLDPAIAGLILCLLAMEKSGASNFFSASPMRVLGVVSYSLFMCHTQWGLPLGKILSPGDAASFGGMLLVYAVSLAVCLALSVFLFAFLERPYYVKS